MPTLDPGLDELVIGDDRLAARGHRADAQILIHIERLKLLDRIGVLGDVHPRPHHGIQVDQHAIAQQLIDLGLAEAIAGREPQQPGAFVVGIVINVQVGIFSPASRDTSTAASVGP